jgi:hypothetical protein
LNVAAAPSLSECAVTSAPSTSITNGWAASIRATGLSWPASPHTRRRATARAAWIARSAADIARWQAARQALERAWADLELQVGPQIRVYGYGYQLARAVLLLDDTAGERDGWVTRADGVRWADVIALGKAARQLLDPEHQGQCLTDCEACALHRAVGRVREVAPRGTTP